MKRQPLLLGTLATTVLVSAGLAFQDDDPPVVGPAAQVASPLSAPQALPRAASVTPAARGAWPEPTAAALAAWGQTPADAPAAAAPRPALRATPRVTAAAPASAAAASPPAAPPVPYRWLGRVDEQGGVPRVLLVGPAQAVLAAEQETLDGVWRVERIDNTAVELQWLPGGSSQRLLPSLS